MTKQTKHAMTKSSRDRAVITALRDLDPAPSTALSAPEREQADALFARIVSSPTTEQTATAPGRSTRRRTRALLGGAAAGVAGLGAAAAFLTGDSAYASWSAVPTAVSAPVAADAVATCRAAQEIRTPVTTTVAERRGGWTFVRLEGASFEAACFMPNDAVGATAGDRLHGVIGSRDAERPPTPRLSPGGLEETMSMTDNGADGWFTAASGYVGPEVTTVTVRPADGPTVQATVENGRFAAWWPGGDPRGGASTTGWSYTVTLQDGSTHEVR